MNTTMNKYHHVVYNLHTMIALVNKSNDVDKKYKINAYQNAIKKLPRNITGRISEPIAGKSIMKKINYIIFHDEDLPEVRDYLILNAFKYAEPLEKSESITNEPSDHTIENGEEEDEEDEEDDDTEEEYQYEDAEEEDEEEEEEEEDEEEEEEEEEEDEEEEEEEEDEEEEEEDEDDEEDDDENKLSSLRILHRMEKYIYDLNMNDKDVNRIRLAIVEYKEKIIKGMLK